MRLFFVFILLFAMLFSTVPAKAAEEGALPEISSKAACLVDSRTGKVLFQQNGDAALPVASVTKVMTLLLVMEALEEETIHLDDIVTVSPEAAGMGGSQVLLEAGGQYTVSDLIKSVVVASGNDASVALAETIEGSHGAFVARMNQRAKNLGLTQTHFYNCTGLPGDDRQDNTMSALDVAIVSRALVQHPLFFQYSTIWVDEIRHSGGRVTMLSNTNKLLRSLQGCDGIKTGSTSAAGFCVSASGVRAGTRMIAVILGGASSDTRFREAAALLQYGFAHYRTQEFIRAGELVESDIPVAGGDAYTLNALAGEGAADLLERNEKREYTRKTVYDSLKAPIRQGASIGTLYLMDGEKIAFCLPLVSDREVEKAAYGMFFKDYLRGFFGLSTG